MWICPGKMWIEPMAIWKGVFWPLILDSLGYANQSLRNGALEDLLFVAARALKI